MLIVLSLYFLIVWLIFFKFKLLPFTKGWKYTVYTIGVIIALYVVAAIKHYTPSSSEATVTAYITQIAPRVSGHVSEIYVESNTQIKEGDSLFQIDQEPYQYRVEQLEASLKLSRLRLQQSKRLASTGAGSQYDVDRYTSEVEQLEAQLESAKFDLEHTTVKAAGDGVVTLFFLTTGEFISAGRGIGGFIRSDQWYIGAIINQNGLERIQPGHLAKITFPAHPGKIWEGEVIKVSSGVGEGQFVASGNLEKIEGMTARQTTTRFPVLISLPEDLPQEMFKPGLSASVTIFTDGPMPWNILSTILLGLGTLFDFF